MASNDPNLPLQYGACDFTTDDEIPAFQYTVEATADTQNWPLLQQGVSDGSFSGMPEDQWLQGTMPAGSARSSNLPQSQQQLQLRQYSKEEWESMRPIITELYITKHRPLVTVMEIMEQQYGFKASESMYKKRLSTWELSKNQKDPKKERKQRSKDKKQQKPSHLSASAASPANSFGESSTMAGNADAGGSSAPLPYSQPMVGGSYVSDSTSSHQGFAAAAQYRTLPAGQHPPNAVFTGMGATTTYAYAPWNQSMQPPAFNDTEEWSLEGDY